MYGRFSEYYPNLVPVDLQTVTGIGFHPRTVNDDLRQHAQPKPCLKMSPILDLYELKFSLVSPRMPESLIASKSRFGTIRL